MTTQVKQEFPAGEFALDPVHSSIGFSVVHNGIATFRSGFGSYEVRLRGGESPKLEGTVDVTSVEVDDEQLEGHLLSPDFFDASRHPTLRFGTTELKVDESGRVTLRGELEIKGQTHEVEASGRFAQLSADVRGSARVGLSLEASVDRRSFGLDWNAELPNGGDALEHDVRIEVDLELVAEEAE